MEGPACDAGQPFGGGVGQVRHRSQRGDGLGLSGRAGQHERGDHALLHGGGQIGQAPPGLLGHLLPAALLVREQGLGDLVERQSLHAGVLGAAAFGFQHDQQRLRLDRQHRLTRLGGASGGRDGGQVGRRDAAGCRVGPDRLAEPPGMIISAAKRADRAHRQVLRRDDPPGRLRDLASDLGEGVGGPGDQHDTDRAGPGMTGQVGKQGGCVLAGVGIIDQDQGRVTAGVHGGQGRAAAPGMQPPGRPRRRSGHGELGDQPGLTYPAGAGHQRDRMPVPVIAPGLEPDQVGGPAPERGRAVPGRQQQPQDTEVMRRFADHRIEHLTAFARGGCDRLPALFRGIDPGCRAQPGYTPGGTPGRPD